MRIMFAALGLAGVLVLGVVLRLLALGEPLWLDELHTAWCISGSFLDVATRAWQGNQSPFFFWLEYPVFHGFGSNEVSLRLISFVASVGILISIPWLVFRWTGSLVGAMVAMMLAAIDDQFIFFSVEARPYALVQLVTLWQVYFFLNVIFSNTKIDKHHALSSFHVVGWVITTVTLFYLHYTSFLLIGSEAVLFVVWLFILRAKHEMCHRKALIGLSVIMVLLLPGLIQLTSIGQGRANWLTITDVENYGLTMVAYWAIFLLPGFTVAMWAVKPSKLWFANPNLLVLLTLIALPVLFCYLGAISQQAPLAHFRFSIGSMTVLIATAGVVIGKLPRRQKFAVAIFVMVLAIATNPLLGWWLDMERWPSQRQEDWRAVVNRINENPAPVVFCPNLVEDAGNNSKEAATFNGSYYAFALNGLYPVSTDAGQLMAVPIIDGQAWLTAEQIQELGTQKGFWLLMRTDSQTASRISEALLNELKSIDIDFVIQQSGRTPLHLYWISER